MNVSWGSLENNSHALSEKRELPFAEVFKLTIEVIIALFGILGNILVIAVISKLGKQKQPSDFYLHNLAIADLGTLLLTFPLAAIREQAPHNWPFGQFGCRFLYPVPEIFYGASVWFITVIAMERYRKVVTVKTLARNKKKTLLRRAMAVGVCVWMASFIILSLPLHFIVRYHENQKGVKWCGPDWPSWDHQRIISGGYYVILTLFLYITPLVIISCTYVKISRMIKRSTVFIKAVKREENISRGAQERRAKSVRLRHNKRVRKILTPLVLVFALTMLPLNSLRVACAVWPAIAEEQYYIQYQYKNLLFVATFFSLLNSSVNPLIYCIVSRDFRKRIKQLCSRC